MTDSKSDLRERGLIGRGTYIMLFNSAGELCVHRRTLSKAIYPGYWDVAAGGMVQANETYAESAARELEEELGVSGVELTAHDHFYFEDTGNRLWCSAFSAVWDGPLILQPGAEIAVLALHEAEEEVGVGIVRVGGNRARAGAGRLRTRETGARRCALQPCSV